MYSPCLFNHLKHVTSSWLTGNGYINDNYIMWCENSVFKKFPGISSKFSTPLITIIIINIIIYLEFMHKLWIYREIQISHTYNIYHNGLCQIWFPGLWRFLEVSLKFLPPSLTIIHKMIQNLNNFEIGPKTMHILRKFNTKTEKQSWDQICSNMDLMSFWIYNF